MTKTRRWAWPVALVGLTLGLAAPPTFAQKKPPAKANPNALTAEYSKLQQDYRQAQQTYYQPIQGLTDESKVRAAMAKLDHKKDPDTLFRPRFEALATGGANRATRLAASLQVLQMLGPNDKALGKSLMDRLVSDNLKFPEIEQVAAYAQMLSYKLEPGTVEASLQRILRDSTAPTGKAVALFQLGQLAQGGQTPDPAKARAFFQRVQTQYPTTRFAKMAERTLFELDNLQVGKTAPDFEATDETGAKFRLADYRGKVVVLDFWGFW